MPLLTTVMGSYRTLYTTADVAGTPDTTLLANVDAYAINGISSTAFDMKEAWGAGDETKGNAVEMIFSHSAGADADGTTSVFELHGAVDGGPRQPICTIALTGGKARVVAASDLITWVDTAVVTSMSSVTISKADDAADRIVRITLDLTGFRYLEGLFTGAGSTAVTAIAYIRPF